MKRTIVYPRDTSSFDNTYCTNEHFSSAWPLQANCISKSQFYAYYNGMIPFDTLLLIPSNSVRCISLLQEAANTLLQRSAVSQIAQK